MNVSVALKWRIGVVSGRMKVASLAETHRLPAMQGAVLPVMKITSISVLCGIAIAATTVVVTAPVTTTGDHEDAVALFEDHAEIINESTVRTTGISADALRIDGFSGRVVNNGEVITEGDHFAVGIRMQAASGVVENNGTITTFGWNGDGIVLFGGDGYVNNVGSIFVQGPGADGFVVEGDDTIIINDGAIYSTGGVRTENQDGSPTYDDATGVYLFGSNNRLDNQQDAVIETTGPEANTVNAGNGNRINNNGQILSSGVSSTTLQIFSNFDATTVLHNAGEIVNSGDWSGSGLFEGAAVVNAGPDLLIDNSGLIVATGENTRAIVSLTPFEGGPGQPDARLRNSGLISSSGAHSEATISLWGSDQFIENGPLGVIEQLAPGRPAILNATYGSQSIANAGLIAGDVLLGDQDDVFEVVDKGQVQGLVDGQGHTDELVVSLSDARLLDGGQFLNFESFSKIGSGALTAAATWNLSPSGVASIDEGALCLASGSELIAGVLVVSGGATLCGTGTVTAALVALPGSTIEPGFSPGGLPIAGPLTATQTVFEIDVGGPGASDRDSVSVAGDVEIDDSSVIFRFINGYLPQAGDSFEWLTTSGAFISNDLQGEVAGVAPGFAFDISADDGAITLVALSDAEPVAQTVRIDVGPGDPKNHVNLDSEGYVKVVVFSTHESSTSRGFDATAIDAATAKFGPNEAPAAPERTKYRDVDSDGLLDAIIEFPIRATGIGCGNINADFSGETFGQSVLSGDAAITTIGCS